MGIFNTRTGKIEADKQDVKKFLEDNKVASQMAGKYESAKEKIKETPKEAVEEFNKTANTQVQKGYRIAQVESVFTDPATTESSNDQKINDLVNPLPKFKPEDVNVQPPNIGNPIKDLKNLWEEWDTPIAIAILLVISGIFLYLLKPVLEIFSSLLEKKEG